MLFKVKFTLVLFLTNFAALQHERIYQVAFYVQLPVNTELIKDEALALTKLDLLPIGIN